MDISSALNTINKLIENDNLSSVQSTINDLISADPGIIDDRFISECNLIESYMKCKATLQEWSYFYTIKLVYEYCEKKYCNDRVCTCQTISSGELLSTDTIWWCWLQGYDAAPSVIKSCYNSLKKLGRNIIIITSDNLSEYVQMPDFILTKWKNGAISNTHFSDLLRLELLTTHGGTWIDSTVYCSDALLINDVLSNYPLFCYSFAMRDSISKHLLFDNWLIHNHAYSQILTDTKQMLYAYYQNEDHIMHYFLFHIFFSLACRRNPEEYRAIPIFSLEPCHILQLEMLNSYDPLRYSHIMKMSGIHKLTYKYDRATDISGTMLEHLICQSLVSNTRT